MNTSDNFQTGCCPRFNPDEWQEKEIIFQDKIFVKDHVTSFLHIPLNFGKVMKRNMDKIEAAKAVSKEQLVLTDEKSSWNTDVLIAVEKEVAGMDSVKLSGKFLSKVFEGPYSKMGNYIREMKNFLASKDKKFYKLFFYYPYCPKCAKAYGKNYIAILAKVD